MTLGTVDLVAVLDDARARTLRALEALRDGDVTHAQQVLDDLVDDLWRAFEKLERP
jgi:hypothetical protein